MDRIIRIIEANIAAIVMGAAAAYGAYLVGTAKTDARLTTLESGAATIKTQFDSHKDAENSFGNCVIRHIDQLRERAKGEAPCVLAAP